MWLTVSEYFPVFVFKIPIPILIFKCYFSTLKNVYMSLLEGFVAE